MHYEVHHPGTAELDTAGVLWKLHSTSSFSAVTTYCLILMKVACSVPIKMADLRCSIYWQTAFCSSNTAAGAFGSIM